MTDTQALIARLEAATGPDRELDAAIALATCAWCRPRSSASNHNLPIENEYGHGFYPKEYTASIDAALTLVPEGMRRRTVVYEDGRAGVQLWWPTEPLPDVWGKAYASEPIATVIAALRAKGDA